MNHYLQLLYAGEGEAKPEESPEDKEKPGTLLHKGHELVAISFHMPTTCEVCPRPLWHMFRPPPALECRSKTLQKVFFFLIIDNFQPDAS